MVSVLNQGSFSLVMAKFQDFSRIFKVCRSFSKSWYNENGDISPSQTKTTTLLQEFLHLTHSDVPYQ